MTRRLAARKPDVVSGTSVSDARRTTALPTDLLNQAGDRLRILALLYAFTFFMAAFLPSLLFSAERQKLFAHPLNWAPGALSIAVALAVAVALMQAQAAAVSVVGRSR